MAITVGYLLERPVAYLQSALNALRRQHAVVKGVPAGFGLGLNYVQQVMLAHEGRVEVESEEGRFSEFTLYFPARSDLTIYGIGNSCEQSLINASLLNERSFQRMQMSSMLPISKNVPNNVK